MADGRNPNLQDYDGYIGDLPSRTYQGRPKHYNWNESHHRPYPSANRYPHPPPGPPGPAPFTRAQSTPHHTDHNRMRHPYYPKPPYHPSQSPPHFQHPHPTSPQLHHPPPILHNKDHSQSSPFARATSSPYSYYYHPASSNAPGSTSNDPKNAKPSKSPKIANKNDPYYNITRTPESPQFHGKSQFVVENVPSKVIAPHSQSVDPSNNNVLSMSDPIMIPPSKAMGGGYGSMNDAQNQRFVLQRQLSEPTSKVSSELRNDLNKLDDNNIRCLPVTPPFGDNNDNNHSSNNNNNNVNHNNNNNNGHHKPMVGASSELTFMTLGQPMSLKHSMSSTHVPQHNPHSMKNYQMYHQMNQVHHDYYNSRNTLYGANNPNLMHNNHNNYSHNNHNNNSNNYGHNNSDNNNNNNNNNGKKGRRRKKNRNNEKQKEEKSENVNGKGNGRGFDFAVHDLSELVKLRKKEVAALKKKVSDVWSSLNSQRKGFSESKKENTHLHKSITDERKALLYAFSSDANEVKSPSEYWIGMAETLKSDIGKLKNKNLATQVGADVTHSHLRSQIEECQKQFVVCKKKREKYREMNMQYELDVIELQESVNACKEDLDQFRHSHFLKNAHWNNANSRSTRTTTTTKDAATENEKDKNDKKDNNTCLEENKKDKESNEETKDVCMEYPPEIVIQQNLIRAQVEFYFSDYNLKRDKRLLEKICKQPKRGYLTVDDTLSLSRVRQLCTSPCNLYQSLVSSLYLDMILMDNNGQTGTKTTANNNNGSSNANNNGNNEDKEPLYVGRKNFSPPTEKEFPFRRSVYIYGLPWYCDEEYVLTMLQAFGGVTKVQFDHGPDTLDRQIMIRMLEKHRVYKLLSKDSAALTMEFNAMHMNESYQCFWCKKNKQCSDGYYHPKRLPNQAPSYRVCLQCGAAKAEEQSLKYDARSKLLQDDRRLRELLLGLPPRAVSQCKTALCVFASQRQASKCVYVRSRLSYDGAFATHYHHYSKLKKEIALSIKPKVKVIRNQPKMSMTGVNTAPVFDQEHTAILQ